MASRGIVGAAGYLPAPPPRPQHDRRGGGWGRWQGHPDGGVLRRGHHDDGGRGCPRWRCARSATSRRTRCGSPPSAPAYADKTNATTIHAALRLGRDVGGLRRQRLRALGDGRAPRRAERPGPAPGGERRPAHRARRRAATRPRAATARPRWSSATTATARVLAELVGGGWATEEFLDRWRTPGRAPGRRCGRSGSARPRYVPLGQARRGTTALKTAGLVADQVDHLAVAGTHSRANAALAKKLGVGDRARRRPRGVGRQPRRRPARLPPDGGARSRRARAGDRAGGAGRRRATSCCSAPPTRWPTWSPARPIAAQVAAGAPLPYGKYLRWRGVLPVEPPRRPEPARPSASAAGRSARLEVRLRRLGRRPRPVTCTCRPQRRGDATDACPDGRRRRHDRHVHGRPARVLAEPAGGVRGRRLRRRRAGCRSSSPTSTSTRCAIGERVEMTFRRLFTADGIHNYFWKARIGP